MYSNHRTSCLVGAQGDTATDHCDPQNLRRGAHQFDKSQDRPASSLPSSRRGYCYSRLGIWAVAHDRPVIRGGRFLQKLAVEYDKRRATYSSLFGCVLRPTSHNRKRSAPIGSMPFAESKTSCMAFFPARPETTLRRLIDTDVACIGSISSTPCRDLEESFEVSNIQGSATLIRSATPLRSVLNVAALVRLAADRGVSVARCLRGTGIESALLHDAEAEVSGDQELAVIHNLLNALEGLPGLGLEAGRRIPLTAYGVLGLGVMSSATGREAVHFAIRHRELVLTLAETTTSEERGVFTTTWAYAGLTPSVQRFLFERDATAYIALFRDRLRLNVWPIRVTCTFAAPSYAQRYVEHFGVEPLFAQPANTVAHRAADVDRPLQEASPQTVQLCHRMCEELVARRRGRSTLSAQVRFLLTRSPGMPRSQEDVASAMHMSTRALRRRLAQEGTHFRDLLDEVRVEQATQRLMSGMTVSQVARDLGYSEPSVFIRAFKQWTGSSPGAYVRAMLGGPRD